MICVACCAVACDFSIYLCASCLCVLKLFKHQHTAAFAKDKAVSFLVEWNGASGKVIGTGKSLHIVEAAQSKFAYARLSAACDADIKVAVLYLSESLADGVGGRCAGCGGAEVCALEACLHGNSTCCHISYHHGNEENGNSVGAFFQILGMFLICKVKTADAYAGDNACTEWVDVLKLCACVINSLESSGDCKLSEAVHSLCFLLVKALFGRKVVDGGSDLYIKIFAGDVVYIGKTKLVSLDIVPEFFYCVAQGGNYSHSRNYYSFHMIPVLSYIESPPEISMT